MNPSPTFDLSIVLPVCKPRPDWPATLINNIQCVKQMMPQLAIQFVVVNDGFETPALKDMFDLLGETYRDLVFVSYPANMGKGYALRTGVNVAEAPLIITTDFDFPYEDQNIADVYQQLVKGYDVVAGRRSPAYYKKLTLKRRIISKSCILLNKVLLGLPDCDTQSGLKGFNQGGKKLFLQTLVNRFLVDTEFLMLAYKKRLLVNIINLELKSHIKFSSMGLKVIKTETRNLFSIIKRKQDLAGSVYTSYHVQPKPQNLPDVRLRRV